MKNIDLMIKDWRHSCNPRAAIRLGEPDGVFSLVSKSKVKISMLSP